MPLQCLVVQTFNCLHAWYRPVELHFVGCWYLSALIHTARPVLETFCLEILPMSRMGLATKKNLFFGKCCNIYSAVISQVTGSKCKAGVWSEKHLEKKENCTNSGSSTPQRQRKLLQPAMVERTLQELLMEHGRRVVTSLSMAMWRLIL